MKSPNRPAAFAALGVSAVLALTGCFSEGSEARAEDAADGRISLAMLMPPRSGLSPLSDDAFKLSRWSTAETLVVLDDLGEAQPQLATEWVQVEPTAWRFTLRDGVSFHDGTPLTSEQVANALNFAAGSSPTPRILDGVEISAEADGESVLVTTGVEDPLLPQRLSSPQLSILAASAYSGDVVTPIGTGSGPFELVSVDGTSSATLDRYDGYWGEPATAAGIDVDFVPDGTARAAALQTGTADIVESIPVGQAAQLDEDMVFEVPMPRTNTLYLNAEQGPFADPAVRAAAREAIDRAGLVAEVYEDRADEAAGLLGPALPWAADLRKADEYQGTLRERMPAAAVDGIAISLGTFTDRAELPEVAVRLEQELEAAGFEVTQDVREYQYIEADALDGVFDAFILSRATVLDSGDPVAYLYSDFACDGSFNISQFCDEQVDEAINAAAAIPAGPERRAAIMAAEALILQHDAAVPLLHERVIQGESSSVSGAIRDPRERVLVNSNTSVSEE